MMMVARGLVRLTIDGDDTSHTTHNLRDCFRVFTPGVVRSTHQVKVSSAVFFVFFFFFFFSRGSTVRSGNKMFPHVSYSGFCSVRDAKLLLLKVGGWVAYVYCRGRQTT